MPPKGGACGRMALELMAVFAFSSPVPRAARNDATTSPPDACARGDRIGKHWLTMRRGRELSGTPRHRAAPRDTSRTRVRPYVEGFRRAPPARILRAAPSFAESASMSLADEVIARRQALAGRNAAVDAEHRWGLALS